VRTLFGRPEPLLFLLLAAAWGSSYLAVGVAGDDVEPFTLVALRLAVGTTALWIVGRARGLARPRTAQVPHLAVVGLLGIALPFTLITYGERTIDAGLASIIVATAPLLTALFLATGAVVGGNPDSGRGTSVGRVGLVGLAVGLAGVAFVAGGGLDSGLDPLGMLLLLGAAASYAANGIYSRRYLTGIPPMTVAMGQAATALVMTLTAALLVDGLPATVPSTESLVAIAWLGILGSAVGSAIYFRLIGAWGPTRTTTVNYLTPIVGVAGGAVLLGEQLPPATLIGGALIIAGVAMANLARPGPGRRSVATAPGIDALGSRRSLGLT